MRGLGATVVLACLTGCAADPRVELRTAQDRWELACGRRPEPTSVVVYPYAVTVPCGATSGAAACTVTRDGVALVTVAGAAGIPLQHLFMHELGHVLGAGHIDAVGDGVMASKLRSSHWRPCLTQTDLDAVADGCLVYRPECP